MPEHMKSPEEIKAQDIKRKLDVYEATKLINNCYDECDWGVYISCMDEYQPAISFKQAMEFVARYNLWVLFDLYPKSTSNDAPMIASVFKWDPEEHGEHDPDSVNWEDPF